MNDPIMRYLNGIAPKRKKSAKAQKTSLWGFDLTPRNKSRTKSRGLRPTVDFNLASLLGFRPTKRDRDGDGVPNRRDCQPDNPFAQDWPEAKDPATGKAPKHSECQKVVPNEIRKLRQGFESIAIAAIVGGKEQHLSNIQKHNEELPDKVVQSIVRNKKAREILDKIEEKTMWLNKDYILSQQHKKVIKMKHRLADFEMAFLPFLPSYVAITKGAGGTEYLDVLDGDDVELAKIYDMANSKEKKILDKKLNITQMERVKFQLLTHETYAVYGKQKNQIHDMAEVYFSEGDPQQERAAELIWKKVKKYGVEKDVEF